VIDLPAEVDLSNARVTFSDGTLEVMMPKAAPAKSLRVETKPELSAEHNTSGAIEAEGTPSLGNEPIVRAHAASSRR
jgi:hypothetical protein